MPELRAATLEELQAVRHALEDISRVMPRQVEAKVAEVSVPRKELRRTLQRWWVLGLALMLLFVLSAVTINRITLLQAQKDLSRQITVCFLRPGANTPAQAQACGRRFGSEYVEVQKRSAQATGQFVSLQKWAKEHGWEPPETPKQ